MCSGKIGTKIPATLQEHLFDEIANDAAIRLSLSDTFANRETVQDSVNQNADILLQSVFDSPHDAHAVVRRLANAPRCESRHCSLHYSNCFVDTQAQHRANAGDKRSLGHLASGLAHKTKHKPLEYQRPKRFDLFRKS